VVATTHYLQCHCVHCLVHSSELLLEVLIRPRVLAVVWIDTPIADLFLDVMEEIALQRVPFPSWTPVPSWEGLPTRCDPLTVILLPKRETRSGVEHVSTGLRVARDTPYAHDAERRVAHKCLAQCRQR